MGAGQSTVRPPGYDIPTNPGNYDSFRRLPTSSVTISPTFQYSQCVSYGCADAPITAGGGAAIGRLDDGKGGFICLYKAGYDTKSSCAFGGSGLKYTSDSTPDYPDGGTDCPYRAPCTSCNSPYNPAGGDCAGCPASTTFAFVENTATCTLTCDEPGQYAITDPSAGPICVDCSDSRIPGSSYIYYYGSASFAIDSNGVCAATSCLAGYGLQPQAGTGTQPNMCQSCGGTNQYSPGGTSACLTCPVQPTDNMCTSASMGAHMRNRRAVSQAEQIIAARQYKFQRQEDSGEKRRRKILQR